MPRIHFADIGMQPAALDAPEGANLMEVLDAAGIPIEHHCGGNCICGTCVVEVLEAGEFPEAKSAELFTLRKVKRAPDSEQGVMRLACQHSLTRDITIRVFPTWRTAAAGAASPANGPNPTKPLAAEPS